MQIKGIHHIALIAKDYAASKDFYQRILGFEVVREVYRAERDSYKLDLAFNGTYMLELFSFPKQAERPSYPEAVGLRHLAFAVADVAAAWEHLRQQGIAVEDIRLDEFTGKNFFFFHDPSGQPLEMYEEA